jgi:N-ethylmaleimide reductase
MTHDQTASLFEPVTLGAIKLSNRVVMAPLTRSPASTMGAPSDIAPEYYAQRYSAGLIITDATQISFEGMGYPRSPALHDADQMDAWRKVVDAVHSKDGRIVM